MSMNKQLNKILTGANYSQPDTDIFCKNNMFYIIMEIPGVIKKCRNIFQDDIVIVKGCKLYQNLIVNQILF